MNLEMLGQNTSQAEVTHISHFYWPDLDVDLSKEIIKNPERFPLKVKA